jgi:protein SCO1/2
MEKKYWLTISAVLAVLLLAGLVSLLKPYQVRGSLIDPAVPAPPVELHATTGSTWKLSDQAGKLVFAFFGYTHCTSECPATLGIMKEIKKSLGNQAADVVFVLITVDPQRDTLDIMKQYLAKFDPGFIGLGGTPEQLAPVYKEYGVYVSIPAAGGSASYEVDHSTQSYLVDRHNDLRITYAFGTPVEDLISDIRFLLKEK